MTARQKNCKSASQSSKKKLATNHLMLCLAIHLCVMQLTLASSLKVGTFTMTIANCIFPIYRFYMITHTYHFDLVRKSTYFNTLYEGRASSTVYNGKPKLAGYHLLTGLRQGAISYLHELATHTPATYTRIYMLV